MRGDLSRRLGSLIPGSRKQKALSEEELERIAAVYRAYKRDKAPEEVPGFAKVASLEEVREHGYALTPGRYVGTEEPEDEDEPFEVRMPELVRKLAAEFEASNRLEEQIRKSLKGLGYEC